MYNKIKRELYATYCEFYTADRMQLGKPSTSSRVCITVSNSLKPSRVDIRLCKHGKHFLSLKYHAIQNTVATWEGCVRYS